MNVTEEQIYCSTTQNDKVILTAKPSGWRNDKDVNGEYWYFTMFIFTCRVLDDVTLLCLRWKVFQAIDVGRFDYFRATTISVLFTSEEDI